MLNPSSISHGLPGGEDVLVSVGYSTPPVDVSRVLAAHKRLMAGSSRASRRLVQQAPAAIRAQRPVYLLAAAMTRLRRLRPRGWAAYSSDRVLAALVVSADWRSGARSRPGRTDTAVLAGVSTRTVVRQWRVLEAAGLIERATDGTRLSSADHDALVDTGAMCTCGMSAAEAAAWRCDHPGQATCRRRDRAEFFIVSPARMGLTDEDITEEALKEATELLAQLGLADPRKPRRNPRAAFDATEATEEATGSATRVEEDDPWAHSEAGEHDIEAFDSDPWAGTVDPDTGEPLTPHHAAPANSPLSTRVTPSRQGTSTSHPPVICGYSYAPITDGSRKSKKTVRSGIDRTATRQARRRQRQKQAPELVEIAFRLRCDARLPQLRRAPIRLLAQAVKPYVDPTVDPGQSAKAIVNAVQVAVKARIERWGHYAVPYVPKRPVAWLTALLGEHWEQDSNSPSPSADRGSRPPGDQSQVSSVSGDHERTAEHREAMVALAELEAAEAAQRRADRAARHSSGGISSHGRAALAHMRSLLSDKRG